jgi:hypothetical protein
MSSLLARFGAFDAAMANAGDPTCTVIPSASAWPPATNGHVPIVTR